MVRQPAIDFNCASWAKPRSEYDRSRRGRRFGRQHRRCGGRGDDGDLLSNQIGRQRWQSIIVVLRPAILDGRVLTVAAFVQTLAECGHGRRIPVRRCAVKETDHRHRRLLRVRRERPPNRRASEQRDGYVTLLWLSKKCMGAQGVQKIMGYSKSNL